jgi:ATP-binding cassette subfamily B (MDR/TAP) protein 1
LGNLLLRLYNPGSGHILLDGEPLDQIDKTWLRENITLVQQQNILFDTSILQNLLYGADEHSNISNDQISKACHFALLQTTINDLEKGLETKVGAQGNSLSGGQKQRVTLARAYLRNSPILILDESTSALDYISRFLIMDAIRTWREGMTTIIVTHDISQIFEDDYVYVMEDGRLVQEGTRKKLEKDHRGAFKGFVDLRIQQKGEKQSGAVGEMVEEDISDTVSISSDDSVDFPNPTDITIPSSTLASPHFQRPGSIDVHRHRAPLDMVIEPVLLGDVTMSPSRGIELTELTGGQNSGCPLSSSRPFLTETSAPAQSSSLLSGSWRSYRQRHETRRKKRKGQKKEATSLKRISKTVWPNLNWKYRMILVTGFIFALLYAITVPLFSWVFARLLATFYQSRGRSQEALRWSLAILGVAIGDATASFFMHYLLECSGQKWVDNLRTEALKRILDQPRVWFDREKNSQSRLVGYLDRNAEEMRNLVGRFAAFLLVGIVMMSIALVWSMITCWKLTLVGLTAVPFMYIVTRSFEHISGKWEGKCNDVAEKAAAVFSETFINIRTVRTLTLESRLRGKHSRITENALRIGLKRSIMSGVFFGLADSAILFITGTL